MLSNRAHKRKDTHCSARVDLEVLRRALAREREYYRHKVDCVHSRYVTTEGTRDTWIYGVPIFERRNAKAGDHDETR